MNEIYKTYTYIGASISAGYYDETGKGWVGRLFERINTDTPASCYVANLANSGDRSVDLLHRLSSSLQRQNDGLIIEIAANDVNRVGGKECPQSIAEGVRDEIYNNLFTLAQANFKEIYLISAFPKNEARMAATRTSDWNIWTDNASIEALNIQISKIAKNYQIPYIDFYSKLQTPEFLDTLEDAVHPNTKGHMMIAEVAYKEFQKLGF